MVIASICPYKTYVGVSQRLLVRLEILGHTQEIQTQAHAHILRKMPLNMFLDTELLENVGCW